MALMTFWTGQMRISPRTASPVPRVLTSQLWSRAPKVMEMVSGVVGAAGILLTGVMTSGTDIVKTPGCGGRIQDFVRTQPFGKKLVATTLKKDNYILD